MTREEREEQIIEAAKSVFIEKGFIGATTNELAKRAGISEVTLFRYFSSKSELFMSAIGPIMTDSLENVLQYDTENPKELIKNFLTERLAFIVKNRELIKLMLMESDLNHDFSIKGQIIERIFNMLNDLFKRLELPEEERNILVRVMIGILLSFLFLPKTERETTDSYITYFLQNIELFLSESKK